MFLFFPGFFPSGLLFLVLIFDKNQFIEQNILPIKNYFREISDKIILSKYGFFKINEIILKLINQIDLKKI